MLFERMIKKMIFPSGWAYNQFAKKSKIVIYSHTHTHTRAHRDVHIPATTTIKSASGHGNITDLSVKRTGFHQSFATF